MWINQLLSSLYIFYQTLTCTHTILYVCHFLYCIQYQLLVITWHFTNPTSCMYKFLGDVNFIVFISSSKFHWQKFKLFGLCQLIGIQIDGHEMDSWLQ